MKNFLLACFLLITTLYSYAQQDPQKMLYLQKAEKYHRMKRTGKTLTLAGSVLQIAGIVTLSNSTSSTTYNSYGQQTSTSGNPGAGFAAYLVGSAALGAGIPLWIVGGINEGRYNRKLEQLTLGFNANPKSAGLTLTYKF